MARLRKESLEAQNKKNQIVSGKIIKAKNNKQKPQLKEPQNNSTKTPAKAFSHQACSSATPLSNSILRFTSTPMNFEHGKTNRGLSLKSKLPPRSPLSPIFLNENDRNTDLGQKKNPNIDKVPLNVLRNSVKASKSHDENIHPKTRTANSKKSTRTSQLKSVSENAKTHLTAPKATKQHKKLSKSPVTNPNLNSSSKCYFLDSSSSDEESDGQVKTSGKNPNSPNNNNTIVNRLQSDWSSVMNPDLTTSIEVQKYSEKSKKADLSAARQYKENKCSKLRIHMHRSPILEDSVDKNTAPSKPSSHYNSLAKRLQSDWSSITLEETHIQNQNTKRHRIHRGQAAKRLLTSLAEVCSEETYNPDEPRVDTLKEVANRDSVSSEEDYSSSDDFQVGTANESRSKKAPTWKDIQNKTNESSVSSKTLEPEAKTRSSLRRSKRLESRESMYSSSCSETDVEKTPQIKNKRNQSSEKSVEPEPKRRRSNRLTSNKSMSEANVEKPENRTNKRTESPGKRKRAEPQAKRKCRVRLRSARSSSREILDSSSSKETSTKNKKNEDIIGKGQKDGQECGVLDRMLLNESHNIVTEERNVDGRKESIAPTLNEQKEPETPKRVENTSPNAETEKIHTVDLTTSRYPNKFFHSRIENTFAPKPVENHKRRKTSKKKKEDSIFDFLSQSSSDTNNPADDIIQKMIKTGKVVVAKHKKGTGKSVVPRKGKPKLQKKKTKTEKEIAKPMKTIVTQQIPLQEQPLDQDINDDFHFDDGGFEVPEEEPIRDQRGFSKLARSAMIKHAGKIQKTPRRKSITDKKKLLEMAIKFVNQSTPVRMTPQPVSAPQFSPMAGNKSPWRVDDDKLPNLFYLGRNSDNLPSFSSDHIPMTPTKNKSKSLSSFSSNDSNGENIAPAAPKTPSNQANVQLSNARKALSYRSPLKAINIIDCVTLPPLALHSYGKKTNTNDKNELNNNSLKKSASDSLSKNVTNRKQNTSDKSKLDISNVSAPILIDSITTYNSGKSGSDVSNGSATNLFGFEELIDNENDSANVTVDKTILPNKDNLKERLQRLKNLRPNKPVIISNKTVPMKPVFDNVRPKQKTLKQMLCSTMIDNERRSDLANNVIRDHSFNETADLSNLFKDPEPETTFDDSNPRRTYNRQFKKKRKLRHNFVMFMDSDVSEDEEEENRKEEPVKKYKATQKKRQKKEDPELNKFVNEFNEMCKEVSQYELIVE